MSATFRAMVAIINSSIPAPGYLIDDRQQIDFHVGFGLDRNAPSYFFGLGYSFRIDGVLQQRDRASTRPLEATPRLNLVTK
jgi:Putative MetA-pathway of phenol degradation